MNLLILIVIWYLKIFEEDLEEVVSKMAFNRSKKIAPCMLWLSEIPKLKNISRRFDELYYSVGLHPLEAHNGNVILNL